MLIDIVTASYKSGNTLQRAIDSVQAQTYQNWHMVIVDDASPDNSADIAREAAAQDARITAVTKGQNEGLIASRNTGLDHCDGDWIAFLDGDDWYKENHLADFIQFQAQHPDTELFVGKPEIIGDPYVPYYYDTEKLVHAHEQAFEGSMFLKRSVVDRLGVVFDPADNVKVLGHKFYDRMVQAGVKITALPGRTCYYNRENAQSITATSVAQMQVNMADMSRRIVTHAPQDLPYLGM